jgi:dihydrofolate reductase
MWNLVTLDGFFEGPKSWDIDWHEYAWGEELEKLSIEQLESADAIIFGRITYQGMAGHWPSAEGETADRMNSVPKIVCSRTLEAAEWNNTRLVKDDVVNEVARLKEERGQNLFVLGSANLSATLSAHGLFDEYRLCVVPVLLGEGSPLFKSSTEQQKLKLLEARPLQTGGVILRYQRDS